MKFQAFFFFCLLSIFQTILSKHRRHTSGRNQNEVEILQWHINTFIQSRFATSFITSKIKNHDQVAREISFSAILPDGAYISNFTMEINGYVTVGQIKEKNLARDDYDRHKSKNISAGLIVKGVREANLFEIFINLEPRTEVHVKLTYEEILERVHGVYKNIIYVKHNQIIRDFKIRVQIIENIEITDLRIPEFAPSVGNMENAELLEKTKLDKQFPDADVEEVDDVGSYKRIIQYHPDIAELENLKNETGQFVILYDVKRDDGYSRTFQVVDGWFVHFFAPKIRAHDVLNKRIVFVLDVSGSMLGEKLIQTKDAMKSILLQLNKLDYFNLITFSSTAHTWKPKTFLEVNSTNIDAAVRYVNTFFASGGTNIDEALMQAMNLLHMNDATAAVSMIIFMTDGQPTWGEIRPDEILKNIQKVNIRDRTKFAIHTMAFGRDADLNLMKRISLNNNGIARRIYEVSDAHHQLEGFYNQISLPLLTNVKIEYLNESVEVGTIVQDINGISYEGNEHISIGKLRKPNNPSTNPAIRAKISSQGQSGSRRSMNMIRRVSNEELLPEDQRSTSLRLSTYGGFVERMWAYKTIKQLTEKYKYVEQDPIQQSVLKSKVLNLSLKYNFVTELTSMVVIVNNNVLPMKTLEPISPNSKKKHYKKVIERRPDAGFELRGLTGDSSREVFNVGPRDIPSTEQLLEISSAEARCEGENEEWKPCGIKCDATCVPPRNCTESNCDRGPPACGCKPGYMRREGRCIPFRNCPIVYNVNYCYSELHSTQHC